MHFLNKNFNFAFLEKIILIYSLNKILMKNFIFLCCSLFLISCGNGNGSATKGSGDFSAYTLESIPGSDVQKAVKKENGVLQEEGFVRNNQKTGMWVTYFPDQKVKSMTSYVDGVKNGLSVKMSDRNQLETQTPFLNDQLHGRKVKYGFNRKEEQVANYAHGQLDGASKTYDKQGVITREIHYKAGQLHGPNVFYSEGVKTMEYEYKNGEKISGGIVPKTEGKEGKKGKK